MMKSDKLNRNDHGGYTEMTAPSSNVNVTDKYESKEITVHETLLDNNSKDVREPERIIVKKLYCRTISWTYQKILLRN